MSDEDGLPYRYVSLEGVTDAMGEGNFASAVNDPLAVPRNPGMILEGWRMTEADAEFFRRLMKAPDERTNQGDER